jgi:hypothetical protein
MLIGFLPNLSVSKALQYPKGCGPYKVMTEHRQLRKLYRGSTCGREATRLRRLGM